MPELLDKFCSILNNIKVGHLLDDLPFALWLGMIPTVRVESMGSGGCSPSPCNSVGMSAALSPPHLEQELQQKGRDIEF